MSIEDGVQLDREGCALVITMNNPGRRNAFYPEMRTRMLNAMRDAAADNSVRAIVLTGADGHFCSGADLTRAVALRDQQPARKGPLAARESLQDVQRLLRVIVAGARPVIAAVEGDAFGGGMAMAAGADRVFAARNARFGSAFSKLGIVPDVGILYTLPLRVGMAAAKDLMYMGDPISGEQAHKLGLADELVEPGQALPAALAYAQKFANLAPLSIGLIKAALSRGITNAEQAMLLELDLQPVATASSDAQEGMLAFKEKRKPRFTGS